MASSRTQGLEERREIDALEFAREGQIFNVFTLRDGRIVRIEDFRERSDALAAAGVSEDVGWR